MYAISLTSIPPRFEALAPVLASLLEQQPAPTRVLLTLPRQYHRFPGPVCPPDLPEGVEILWSDTDFGPATKVIPAARALAGAGQRLLYCDDDWLYPPHWAQSLLTQDKTATTGQAWDIARLGRYGTGTDIAQGFAGVCVDPAWLAGRDIAPPQIAWPVDDIWLSGHLARQGIPIEERPGARTGMTPAFSDTHALQTTTPRDAANRATAALLHDRYGLWPPRSAS